MHNFSYENEFYLHVNENSFSYERLCTKTRFEKRGTTQLGSAMASRVPIFTSWSLQALHSLIKPGHLEHITSLNPAMRTCSEILM